MIEKYREPVDGNFCDATPEILKKLKLECDSDSCSSDSDNEDQTPPNDLVN